MKILSLFFLFLVIPLNAQEFSVLDLYQVSRASGLGIEVLNPTTNNMEDIMQEVQDMENYEEKYGDDPDDDCDVHFYGNDLSFSDVMEILPSNFKHEVQTTEIGNKLNQSLASDSFTSAIADCSSHNGSARSLFIVHNDLKFGLQRIQYWD